MSYYFCIVGTKDNPLFELEFGTSKQGGDGVARFSTEARQLNPFIVHASLDVVEEVQWLNSQMLVYVSFSGYVHEQFPADVSDAMLLLLTIVEGI